jgi:hypothetical protein
VECNQQRSAEEQLDSATLLASQQRDAVKWGHFRGRSGESTPRHFYQLLLLTSPPSLNYEVEEDEVGGACGTNGREEERV